MTLCRFIFPHLSEKCHWIMKKSLNWFMSYHLSSTRTTYQFSIKHAWSYNVVHANNKYFSLLFIWTQSSILFVVLCTFACISHITNSDTNIYTLHTIHISLVPLTHIRFLISIRSNFNSIPNHLKMTTNTIISDWTQTNILFNALHFYSIYTWQFEYKDFVSHEIYITYFFVHSLFQSIIFQI